MVAIPRKVSVLLMIQETLSRWFMTLPFIMNIDRFDIQNIIKIWMQLFKGKNLLLMSWQMSCDDSTNDSNKKLSYLKRNWLMTSPFFKHMCNLVLLHMTIGWIHSGISKFDKMNHDWVCCDDSANDSDKKLSCFKKWYELTFPFFNYFMCNLVLYEVPYFLI